MSQRREEARCILWRRTLTAVTAFWFYLVATVGIVVYLGGGTGVVEEIVVEKV